MDSFNNRLNKAFEIFNKKPVELAKALDISEATISNYRKGKYEPKQNRLHEIALFFNVSEAWLMGYDVDIQRKPVEKSTDLSDRFVALFKQLSTEQQKMIIAQIQGILTSQQSQSEHPQEAD